MKHRPKLHLHIGLRIFKTALAVTIALVAAQAFHSYSPIFAGLGAVISMARTFRESLQAAKTQFVGVILGGIVGALLLLIDSTPSPLLTGIGVLAVLCLCSFFRVYYAVSLAAVIVLSVCVSTSGNPIPALGYRLVDTSIGIVAGLAVNMFIKPYNNRPRVMELFHKILNQLPACLDACVIRDLYPDLTPLETDLRALDVELEIYHRQHFRRREAHEKDVVFLRGMFQLADRIYQEMNALCCMDFIGVPDPEHCRRLEELGLEVPDFSDRRCPDEINLVTNYHLQKILEAREYLLALLELPPDP